MPPLLMPLLITGWGAQSGGRAKAEVAIHGWSSVLVVAGMGHMSGVAEPWIPGFDLASGTLMLPLWSAAVIAALFVAFCVFLLGRAGRDGMVEAFSRAGLLLVGAAASWIILDATSAGTFAAQRRALDARLLEMTTRAVMPGSALACLDATAGDLVEVACEKALFATPEAAAASVAYVTAQLSLLADGGEYERRSGANYESALGGLRHAVETDRFGIVAHVLANRDGCTADRCAAFGLLRDTSQVSDNLHGHKYESYVMHHAAEWPQSVLSPVAANTPESVPSSPPAPPPARVQNSASAAASKPNGLYFPSSASIPAVSIMSAEPGGQAAPPADVTAKPPADGTAKPPAPAIRKPTPSTQQARRPTNLAAPAPGRPALAPEQVGDP
jgi:hypothetical protein